MGRRCLNGMEKNRKWTIPLLSDNHAMPSAVPFPEHTPRFPLPYAGKALRREKSDYFSVFRRVSS
jgi:hypothetical protein